MSYLLSCFFFLVIALNTYLTAKRQGRWSWPQFFVVVVALVAIPILIEIPLMHVAWLQDKPVAFALIFTGIIIVAVGALAFALNKFWPLPRKGRT